MYERRVGLTKKFNRPNLLHTIHGQPRDESVDRRKRTRDAAKPPSKRMKDDSPMGQMKAEHDENITRPPDDSEDEDLTGLYPPFLHESDDENSSWQSDIKPSNFQTGRAGRLNESAEPTKLRLSERGSRALREQRGPTSSSEAQDVSPNRKSGRGKESSSSQQSHGSHLTDEVGFIQLSQNQSKMKRGAKVGYGSRSTKPCVRKETLSPEPTFKNTPKPSSPVFGTPERKYREPPITDMPDSGEGPKFRDPNINLSLDDSPISSSFKQPRANMVDSSPLKYEERSFQMPNLSYMDDSTQDDSFQFPNFPSSPDVPQGTEGSSRFEPESCNEGQDRNILADSKGEALGSVSPDRPTTKPDVTCPMCGEAVDAEHLKDYSGGKRMNIRTQAKFCLAHKKRSARVEYSDRGYPTIDWHRLDMRISQHHAYLEALLDGTESYYRNVLEESVKSGKNRTLKQSMFSSSGQSLTPGYYGSRGLRAMSENIMAKFSPVLRRIAVTDRLVSARGVTGYVQSVLVQELAARLIQEDMAVGIEEARLVLEDSVSLGDLLNEELAEVVLRRLEDRDERVGNGEASSDYA